MGAAPRMPHKTDPYMGAAPRMPHLRATPRHAHRHKRQMSIKRLQT